MACYETQQVFIISLRRSYEAKRVDRGVLGKPLKGNRNVQPLRESATCSYLTSRQLRNINCHQTHSCHACEAMAGIACSQRGRNRSRLTPSSCFLPAVLQHTEAPQSPETRPWTSALARALELEHRVPGSGCSPQAPLAPQSTLQLIRCAC